ncbi:MAG: endolytic transglycosylase MltG [Mageeibacillus sp.]|jgi:UPF0755 protein|nr:endolytic transglycosylase MltG [Mageeibacillus sp.]MCI1264721.1 endolytic transglycosylase MltG [Saccharofermentans sp.]MCI1770053.1 endolytic transglycosylase MltG [Mageeibacillus sp.]MCI2043884.1 endolytic transglycosylase MltG [Mageeibacillus sp.]
MLPKKIKVAIRILVIIVLLFGFAIAGVIFGYNYVISQEERFDNLQSEIDSGDLVINDKTQGAVALVVETGDDTSDIADKLYEQGLITNTFVFSLVSKVNGFDGAYSAGTHYLLQGLSYDEIMYFLTLEPASVTVTIPEGSTYIELKQLLHDAGLSFDDAKFDECMNSPNLFVDYDFVSDIEMNDNRDYILAGYLYPDTYTFDVNSSPEEIIRKFLNNMESKLYDEYYTRAEHLGMTMDQVITMASIIQKETGDVSDMMDISAVFHNRLDSDDESMHYLSSSATINYLVERQGGEFSLMHTDAELNIDSPYNTYLNEGLPPGPICMPGQDAISAALYPEPNCNYMYFCATGDGGTAFAVTLEEHEANVAQYSPNWGVGNDVTSETISDDDYAGDETVAAEG